MNKFVEPTENNGNVLIKRFLLMITYHNTGGDTNGVGAKTEPKSSMPIGFNRQS